MPKNPLLDVMFAAIFCWYLYVLGRMIARREALVRDGWTKWNWEPASIYPGFFVYGLFMAILMMCFSALAIYADFQGWLR